MKQKKNITLLLLGGLLLQIGIGLAASLDYSKLSTEELKTLLIEAIDQNNEDMVPKILACPEAKKFSQYDLKKALELAAKKNQVTIARSLIGAGADIKDRYSYALENAAEKGHLDMVKILLPVQGCDKRDHSLSQNLDIHDLNCCRDEALIRAATNNHIDVVKELINSGANVNYQNNFGQIALIEAAKEGHVDVVKVLIQAKANVNAYNSRGVTALMIAMHSLNVDLIRELLIAPNINAAQYIASIQEEYERYLKTPDLLKSTYTEKELKIYELFKPFMRLK